MGDTVAFPDLVREMNNLARHSESQQEDGDDRVQAPQAVLCLLGRTQHQNNLRLERYT